VNVGIDPGVRKYWNIQKKSTHNQGCVNVGIDPDTAEFAVESIRRWWQQLGQPQDRRAKHLLITADCGGSNGYRNRLWKFKLQPLADETGLTLPICHFPPGTSKWNQIEHRLFCHITTNWRGQPLTSLATVIHLISHTTTRAGLEVHAQIDDNRYPTGLEVTDEQWVFRIWYDIVTVYTFHRYAAIINSTTGFRRSYC
jgi:hypothetical protein